MNILPNIMIFSVYRKHINNESNERAHRGILNTFQSMGIPCMELDGKFKNVHEKSILVTGFEHRQAVERACAFFDQECYLESHSDRSSFLVYPDNSRVSVGKLISVPKAEALLLDNYSYNPVVDQYFVTKSDF